MIVVLADDLSGAAEIGGVAWRYGLTAEIQHDFDATADVELVIVNTDARSRAVGDSAKGIEDLAACCNDAGIHQVFIKVDSVLRGHVLADLTAAMRGLERKRVLLAPANPGLGRTIEQGHYRIDGVALHETQFGHDPDFPATTSLVASLLQQRRADRAVDCQPVTVKASGSTLPDKGVIVCEATQSSELTTWAAAIGADDLPAGAAEFFAAYLQITGCAKATKDSLRAPLNSPASPRLFVCGSGSTATQEFCRQSAMSGVPLLAMPQALFDGRSDENDKLIAPWADAAIAALTRSPSAIIAINRPIANTPDSPEQLTQLLGAATASILTGANVGEIFVEGGATAAAVIETLGWPRLRVEEELAPGIVRTRPVGAHGLRLTMKPGSYHWPVSVNIPN